MFFVCLLLALGLQVVRIMLSVVRKFAPTNAVGITPHILQPTLPKGLTAWLAVGVSRPYLSRHCCLVSESMPIIFAH